MSENLEDHIDDPIKKCVVGMALLGFKPMMSCCGFTYKGEKVPKKHLEKTYLYLDYDGVINNNLGNKLIQIAYKSGWTINPFPNSNFIDFYASTWENKHPWNDSKCPHFYEKFLIAISNLEKTLNNFSLYFNKEAIIDDGNSFYKENVSKHWQYEPTNPWKVTPEIYNKL